MTVHNWARNEACDPRRTESPATEAEVVAVVKRAAAEGLPIRVGGALHSWSRVAMTDGVLVSLDKLGHVVAIDGDVVTVEAGIRLHVLVEQLAERGLALPITGSILAQSLAGAMSTGTHGSSLVHGCYSALVTGLRVVVASGEVLDLGPEDPRLGAFACSLGVLGVITRVTFRAVPLFRLREVQRTYAYDDAVTAFFETGRAREYAKFWWLPHTARASVYHYERTDAAPDLSLWWRQIDDAIVNRWLFAGLLAGAARVPSVIPAMNRLVAAVYFGDRSRVGRYDHVLTTPMPPRHRESEWAVPLDAAPAVLRATRDRIDRDGLRVDFLFEARLVRGDTTWMAPSSGRDVCAIGAYAAGGPDRARFFGTFADLARDHGGRPHWGKEFTATRDEVTRWYPRAEEFRALARAVDPDGRFASEWSRPLFSA